MTFLALELKQLLLIAHAFSFFFFFVGSRIWRFVHQQWSRRSASLPGHHRQRAEDGERGWPQAGFRHLPGTPAALFGHWSKDLQNEVSNHLIAQVSLFSWALAVSSVVTFWVVELEWRATPLHVLSDPLRSALVWNASCRRSQQLCVLVLIKAEQTKARWAASESDGCFIGGGASKVTNANKCSRNDNSQHVLVVLCQ